MTKQEYIDLTHELGIVFNHFKNKYYKLDGTELVNVNHYIKVCLQKKNIDNQDKEVDKIKKILFESFDFKNIPYKTYLKLIVNIWHDHDIIRILKDKYSEYLESIQNQDTHKQCIFLTGKAGSGKTTYAKILAEKHYKSDEIFITSAGDNPFDDYYGEKCVIIDDFRDSVFKYNDLLRLLDNNTSSSIGARYYNKNLARCELILLTSTKHPTQLYKNIEEERYQLYRRLELLKVIDKNLFWYVYDQNKGMYVERFNPLDISEELDNYFKNHQGVNKVDLNSLFASTLVDIDPDLPL